MATANDGEDEAEGLGREDKSPSLPSAQGSRQRKDRAGGGEARRDGSAVTSPPGAPQTGESAASPRRFRSKGATWLWFLSGCAALLMVQASLFAGETLLTAAFSGMFVGGIVATLLLGLWIAWRVLIALRWVITVALLVGGGCLSSAVVSNSDCIDGGELDDDGLCVILGSIAEPLPTIVSSEDFALSEASGRPKVERSLIGAAHAQEAQDLLNLLANALRDEPSAVDRSKLNRCFMSLYEVPAIQLQAKLVTRWNFSVPEAEDAVMDTLLAVCTFEMHQPIENLRPYFTQAVNHRATDRSRTRNRERPCEAPEEYGQLCWSDAHEFSRAQVRLYREAVCTLEPVQRRAIDRWREGGTWLEVAEDLGTTRAEAANAFNSGVRKIRRYIDSRSCRR